MTITITIRLPRWARRHRRSLDEILAPYHLAE